nr:uncharacterized protein LOC105344738 [Crassostrea gigas]
MMSVSSSSSALLREEGNQIYKTACVEGLSPAIQIGRLQKARNLYYRAHTSDGSEDDKCSAAKNLALCEWHIGKLHIVRKERNENVVHQFKEALKYYQYAFVNGGICKNSTWITDLQLKYTDCFEEFMSFLSDLSIENRIRYFNQISSLMSISELLAIINLQLVKHHFHEAINAWQKGDYMKCKHQMTECHYPLHEGRKHGHEQPDVLQELVVLETDVNMHMCIAESSKARQTGDDLLEKASRYYETINMNMVWEIIDWYKQAILLARELDIEQEAIAMQRIGRVYAKVLKFKPQAKEYYKRAVQMAVSMAPRTFTTCDWYQECTEMLKKYQEETITHEQEEQYKAKEKIKEEMKDELDQIKKSHERQNNIEFLKCVYNRYPPKNETFKLMEDAEENIKRALQKAVIHYHPDKSEPEKNGMKWKIMSEEITKYLTSRYEVLKFTS